MPPQILTISNTKEARRVLVSHVDTPSDFYVNMCDKSIAKHFNVLNDIGEYYDRLYNSMLRDFLSDYKPQVRLYNTLLASRTNTWFETSYSCDHVTAYSEERSLTSIWLVPSS